MTNIRLCTLLGSVEEGGRDGGTERRKERVQEVVVYVAATAVPQTRPRGQ